MKFFIVGGLAVVALVFGWNFIVPTEEIVVYPSSRASGKNALNEEKTPEERIKEAEERASVIKGLYMTADVANDQGGPATRLRDNLIKLAETTEINGMVIDVKEVCGPDYDENNLRKLLDELHEIVFNVRVCAFGIGLRPAGESSAVHHRSEQRRMGGESERT